MLTNSNQSGKAKRWIFTGFLIMVVLMLIGLLVYSNWRIFKKRKEVKAELNQLSRKMEALKQEKFTIRASLHEKDSYVVEEIAREQMNLKKPGEKVIDVKKPLREEKERQEKKWWRRWMSKSRALLNEGMKKIQFWK